MAFGVNFGFQNPVAVQDALVNQFIGNGLGAPTAPPVAAAPVFNAAVPLDAQLSLSLRARTLAAPATEPTQQHHHGNGHGQGHAYGHQKHHHHQGPVSSEGMAYLQRRGNNGFR